MKVAEKPTKWDPFIVFPAIAALVLGIVGFLPGLAFLGPLGQGSTGQLGSVLGCVAGFAAAICGLSTRGFLMALAITAAVWATVLFVWRRSYLAAL